MSSYAGDLNLVQSVIRTIRCGPITAELHLIDAIDGATTTRHEVAHRARIAIAAALGFDDEAEEALEEMTSVMIAPASDGDPRRRAFDRDLSGDVALADRGPETVLDPRDELL